MLTKAGKIIKDEFQRYDVQAANRQTNDYDKPHYLIDASRAEPEVNWPGELIGEYPTSDAAHDARWNIVADVLMADLLAQLKQCQIELAEAAKLLLRPIALPSVASIYEQAAQRVKSKLEAYDNVEDRTDNKA